MKGSAAIAIIAIIIVTIEIGAILYWGITTGSFKEPPKQPTELIYISEGVCYVDNGFTITLKAAETAKKKIQTSEISFKVDDIQIEPTWEAPGELTKEGSRTNLLTFNFSGTGDHLIQAIGPENSDALLISCRPPETGNLQSEQNPEFTEETPEGEFIQENTTEIFLSEVQCSGGEFTGILENHGINPITTSEISASIDGQSTQTSWDSSSIEPDNYSTFTIAYPSGISGNTYSLELSTPSNTLQEDVVCTESGGTRPHLAFMFSSASDQTNNLNVLTGNLMPGDRLIVAGNSAEASWVLSKEDEASSLADSEVLVSSAIIFTDVGSIETNVASIPSGIDWIIYNYNQETTPEFTTNQQTSITYFDRAYTAASDSGLGLILVMNYSQLRSYDWDWGEVATHTNAINLKFDNFVQDQNVLQAEAANIYQYIADVSPSTLTMIQFSIEPGVASVDDSLNAIETLREENIGAFMINYQSNQGTDLTNFFNQFGTRFS